jgi:hypothetical protein
MAPALDTDVHPHRADLATPSSAPSSVPALAFEGELLMEHAKGALMLRYGIDSCQALAVLVHWARGSSTSLEVVAHTLVHGICEGNPQTAARQRPLMRWLEQELRQHDLDLVRATSPPARAGDR